MARAPARRALWAAAVLAVLCACSESPAGLAAGPRAAVGVAAGYGHSCALAASGAVYCWGDDSGGQLGDGFSDWSATPVQLADRHSFTALGNGGLCGLTTDGLIHCWGSSAGRAGGLPGPYRATSAWRFTDFVAYGSSGCGLDRSGAAFCWGFGELGQLGNDTTLSSDTPVPVAGAHRFRKLAVGSQHACGLDDDGAAWCWGDGYYGQLGTDSLAVPRYRTRPARVLGDIRFRDLSAWFYHTCGVATDGVAWCWGYNYFGVLGSAIIPVDLWTRVPAAVSGRSDFVTIGTGYDHTCGVTASGAAWCWGANSWGQLGTGDTASSTRPVAVRGGLRFTSVSVGERHTCGVTGEGYVYCWGDNRWGKLGDGTTTRRTEPVQVSLFP